MVLLQVVLTRHLTAASTAADAAAPPPPLAPVVVPAVAARLGDVTMYRPLVLAAVPGVASPLHVTAAAQRGGTLLQVTGECGDSAVPLTLSLPWPWPWDAAAVAVAGHRLTAWLRDVGALGPPAASPPPDTLLRCSMQQLTDDLVAAVASFADARSVGRLACSCRSVTAAVNVEEVWAPQVALLTASARDDAVARVSAEAAAVAAPAGGAGGGDGGGIGGGRPRDCFTRSVMRAAATALAEERERRRLLGLTIASHQWPQLLPPGVSRELSPAHGPVHPFGPLVPPGVAALPPPGSIADTRALADPLWAAFGGPGGGAGGGSGAATAGSLFGGGAGLR